MVGTSGLVSKDNRGRRIPASLSSDCVQLRHPAILSRPHPAQASLPRAITPHPRLCSLSLTTHPLHTVLSILASILPVPSPTASRRRKAHPVTSRLNVPPKPTSTSGRFTSPSNEHCLIARHLAQSCAQHSARSRSLVILRPVKSERRSQQHGASATMQVSVPEEKQRVTEQYPV
jgi:hypothetical protein